MKLFLKILTIFAFSQLIVFSVSAACLDNAGKEVFVNGQPADKKYCCDNYKSSNESLCSGSATADSKVDLKNPLGDKYLTPQQLIGRLINTILGIVGSLALLMFIYGGLVWMTAAGNDQSVTKGKNILLWATIGLVVIFSSYALVKFLITDVIKGGG